MSLKIDDRDTTAYPKIPGPYARDPETMQLTREWATAGIAATAALPWRFTEKIDGTNVRVIWDGYRVRFAGRTERSQFPLELHSWLYAKFGGPEKEQLFEQKFGANHAVLYGEGYGAGIQAGGKYRRDIAVVFYDVLVENRWWLQLGGIAETAGYFLTNAVPERGRARTLTEAIHELEHAPLLSKWGDFPAEGLVGHTAAGLRDRAGDRITVKLKQRDLTPKGTP